MTDWKTVHADVEPKLIDMESSPTTVYERRNVRKEEILSMNESVVMWVYEEKTYTKEEYNAMNSPFAKMVMQTLSDLELQIASIGE